MALEEIEILSLETTLPEEPDEVAWFEIKLTFKVRKESFHYSSIYKATQMLVETPVWGENKILRASNRAHEDETLYSLNFDYLTQSEKDEEVFTLHSSSSYTPFIQEIVKEIEILRNGGSLNYRTVDDQIFEMHVETIAKYWD